MTQNNFVALKLITSNPVICDKYMYSVFFVDIYDSCSHDGDFINGYADEHSHCTTFQECTER